MKGNSIKSNSIRNNIAKTGSMNNNIAKTGSMNNNIAKTGSIKDNSIQEFFQQHRQDVQDNGFSERLFVALECMPKPAPVSKPGHIKYMSNNGIIILLSSLIGIILFFVFGGYSVVIESLVSLGSVVEGTTLITPQFVISICFLLGSLFFLSKFAIEAE